MKLLAASIFAIAAVALVVGWRATQHHSSPQPIQHSSPYDAVGH